MTIIETTRKRDQQGMASRYDELDASTQLEQQLAADLRRAFEPRGCTVVHHGTNSGGRHSPGGKPDIEVQDPANGRLILVEVTKRRGSAADGEFLAVKDHLSRAIAAGGYRDYGMLYVSPATSARMSTNFRDLYNRNQEREGTPGRMVGLDFEATQLMLDKLSSADPQLYPSSRLGDFFARWSTAVDDARARELVQQTIFPEDLELAAELAEESQEFDAQRERQLKKDLQKVENDFRSHGITGNNANITLVYLAFIRLYEERRQRHTGQQSRFTLDGFRSWREGVPAAWHRSYGGRMVEALLHEISEDPSLRETGLLQPVGGVPVTFHARINDELVEKLILPAFDRYDFHAGRVDVLGAVFETLARRSEKDTRVGQFFTPAQVVSFGADLVEMRATDVTLDPAVGTGRFLIAAMEHMLSKAHLATSPLQEVEKSIRERQLLGADIDDWVSTIAKMNMFIHGDGRSGIATVNGLALADRSVFPGRETGLNGSVDIVLTNPPLGDTDYTAALQSWIALGGEADDSAAFYQSLGVVPLETVEERQLAEQQKRHEASIALISELEAMEPAERPRGKLTRTISARDRAAARIVELRHAISSGQVTQVPRGRSLKGGALFLGAIANYLRGDRDQNAGIEWQGGRTAIVVDEAVLNTPEYSVVREFVRRHFFVKAVVSLSRDAFKYLAHTDAKTSVLYLIKKPDVQLIQKEPIFFSHAERVGYSALGTWVGDDLPQVLNSYRSFQSAVLRSYRNRYLDAPGALSATQALPGHGETFFSRADEGVGGGRLDFYDARFTQRRAEMAIRYGALISLGDILEVVSRVSPEASRNGEYDFALAARTGEVVRKGQAKVDYSPSDLWVVQKGDLVLSSIDLVNGAVAVAGDDVHGLVMSKEMYAYRLREGASERASLEYIQILLRSDAAKEMLLGFTTGTSNRTRLENAEQLLEFPIPPLPEMAEQNEKSEKLREAYALVREAKERLAELQAYAERSLRDDSSAAVLASASVVGDLA
ncbi:hypothetical protein J2W21_003021 [Sinomonas atrocyanea]|uniref:N-6 DNA methylase n=1 Tax=Sinomonas atrocyanea TaxID=37927 RepID=UPI00278B8A89|nr:N-6 DNA methylase [Sinomonas atrocyanea]MDP9885498.1 hypothetical protein [Sinomonas atrocyanea]